MSNDNLSLSLKEIQYGELQVHWVDFEIPYFLDYRLYKNFYAAPIEFIVKLVMLCLFVLVSILKYRYSVTFKNDRVYRECMDEWREVFPSFFHLASFDFKGTINFLKYGKFA